MANHWPAASTALSPLNSVPGPGSTRPCAPGPPPCRPQLCERWREVSTRTRHSCVALIDPPQPHAAAIGARAARAVHQLVAQQRQRIFDLQRLDRQVRGVGHVHVHAVQPVLGRRARRSRRRSSPDRPRAAVVGSLADEDRRRCRPPLQAAMTRSGIACASAPCTRSTTRWQVCRRAVDRRGMRAVEDRALAAPRPRAAAPARHSAGSSGSTHRLDGVIDGREQRGVDHVDAGAHLRRARRNASDIVIALHRHLDGERQVARRSPRLSNPSSKRVGAVGDGGDRRRASCARHSPCSAVAGRQHDVARRTCAHSDWKRWTPSRLAAIWARKSDSRSRGTWQFSRIRSCTSCLQLARAVEPDRRDAQPLLEDVGVAAIDEVGVVRDVDRPGDELAVDEDRLGQHDVRQVRAAALVGVVADEDVARPDRPRPDGAS